MEDDFNELGPAEPLNPYQSSSYEPYRSPTMHQGNGQTALWLGVISMVTSGMGGLCCVVFSLVGAVVGVVAVVLGIKELRAVREGNSHPNNRSYAQLGLVFGSIGIGISLLLMLFMIGFIVFAILVDPPR